MALLPLAVFLAWVVSLASFNRVRRREREALFDTFIAALASGGAVGALFGIGFYLGSESLFAAFGTLVLAFIAVAVATYMAVILVYAYFWADVINHRFFQPQD